MNIDCQKRDHTKRIFLWANIRSLGTAVLKCLSNVPDSQIISGIFWSCYFHGPDSPQLTKVADSQEANVSEFPFVYDASSATYSWAKTQLECEYPGKKYLICKDLPYSLCGNHEVIPKGFRHTFLIRHPYRMYSSWKNNISRYYPTSNLKEMIEKYYNQQFNYKEQYDLLKYLQNHPEMGDPNPVVIDADDLQRDPASVLSQYCHAVGIPYTDDMLCWSPGTDVLKNWSIPRQLLGRGLHEKWGYYRTAMESTHFLPPKKLPARCELDADVLECADIGMPFYEKLYNMRTIKP